MGDFSRGPRSADVVSQVWEALRPFQHGATAKVIAGKLGWPQPKASQMLGRLAVYDVIDRVPINVSYGPGRPSKREYRYSIRRRANA